MRLTRRTLLQGTAAAAAAGSLPGRAGADARLRTDRLWYRQPARIWTEALPVGNGRIGAMVYGGTAHERIQLNEDTLYAGGPYDPVNPDSKAALPEVRRLIAAGEYAAAQALADKALIARPYKQMPYQTVGELLLDMPGVADQPAGYARELDIDRACVTTWFKGARGAVTRTLVASPDRQVIAVEIAGDASGAIDLDCRFASAQPGETRASGDSIAFLGTNRPASGIAAALKLAARVRVLPTGGTMSVAGERIRVRGADRVTILIAMATSYRRFDDVGGDPEAIVSRQIARGSALPFARIADETAVAHQRLYRRVTLDLGRADAADLPTDGRIRANESTDDPGLAALYFHYARYLLICSSRPGSQPANLQGIWNDSNTPPWESKYTININTQMNYWPAEPAALPECVEPLVTMVRDLAVAGARTAREMYGARGWVAHHNTDLWRATAPIDGAFWGMWPTGGAWLCLHLWDRWDYGRDRAYLASVYPLMKGAALFFLDTLQVDAATGTLVTSPSISPENAHHRDVSICAGPAMDRQILRDLFDHVAAAADILGTDAAFAAEVRAARVRLAPDRIGAGGQLQEWLEDWDGDAPEPRHRHVSHLYGLFPSHQIDPRRTPDLAAAARRSLDQRGDESTGWATAWRIALWTRLGDAERAHRILRFLLGPGRTYPNLFDAHPPFQIDGNFGGAAAIAEMLMQSDGDTVRLLPALPAAWPTGSITGLRARGGVSVDLSWRDGAPERVTLRATAARSVRLASGMRTITVPLRPGRPRHLTNRDFAKDLPT